MPFNGHFWDRFALALMGDSLSASTGAGILRAAPVDCAKGSA